MRATKHIKIHKYDNFRVLEVDGFARVAFGCPPGIVKEFSRRNHELPRHFVIPIRTFVKGRNNFDFEFIIYSFLFVSGKKMAPGEKITIYCTHEQKERFRIILNETLFGPQFARLLQGQMRRFFHKQNLSIAELRRIDRFWEKIAADKKLYNLYGGLLKSHASEKKVLTCVQEYFNSKKVIPAWLEKKKIPLIEQSLAKGYVVAGQLKKEMDLFGLVEEGKRDQFIDSIVQFNLFDKHHTVKIQGKKDKRQILSIIQDRPSAFDVKYKNKTIGTVDISHLDPPAKLMDIEPIEKPYMGVTFMGVGSGFSHKRQNSSLIAWSEGKGILVDAFPNSTEIAMMHGIPEKDVAYMVLTHVHSDHDAGLIEKIMSGQRVQLVSTRIIFESFLRKLEALTCFPMDVVEGFIDFFEVEPNKPVRLPGFKSTYFTFDYSLHSIPCGRFTLEYREKNGKTRTLSHSGDTKYDVDKVNNWYQQGVFTRKRRDSILGFIWDAELIIHDLGGGTLHTELKSLEHLDDALLKKVVLVHQHEDPKPHPRFTYAEEGQSFYLIKDKTVTQTVDFEAMKQVPLFKELREADLLEILNHSQVVKYQPDEIVFSQNDIGNDFYIILDGFAEIIIDGKSFAIYERGKFFGELAITTTNPHRRATIEAKTPLTLLKISRQLYKKFNLPKIQDEFYKMNNYFNDVMHPCLIASLAFGKVVHWNRNDIIDDKRAGAKKIYIILSGQVAIEDKKQHARALLSSGDIVGKVDGLKDIRWATALAHSDEVYAIRLNKTQLQRVFKLFPSFYGTVYKKLKKLEAALS